MLYRLMIVLAIAVSLSCAAAAQTEGDAPAKSDNAAQPSDADDAASNTADDDASEPADTATEDATDEADIDEPADTAEPTTQPTTQPATEPDDARGGDITPEASGWLKKIEAVSEKTDTFTSSIRFDTHTGLLGDMSRRFGTLVYTAGPPARFSVHFDRLVVDDVTRKQDRYWIFDGTWLVERVDDKKQFFKRQIVAPNTPPEKADPLALGDGPFPLPIRAKESDIAKRFDVVYIEPAEDDKEDAGRVHLRFTPRKHIKMDVDRIDIWWSRETLLPVQVESVKEASGSRRVFLLYRTKVNEEVAKDAFDVTPPKSSDWLVEITPWGK